jgi:BirA family biotin operon repressor/biotin-[acetyl-CoA-carboxylase] ligase
MNDRLDIEAIKQRLRPLVIGREIIYKRKTVSTNQDAFQLANNGAQEGTVVIADEQTGGKGRFDRRWLSRYGENILMSIILRPRVDMARSFQLTMIASLAVVRAIESVAGITAKIKWPNDVFIGGRKVCGILTELQNQGQVLSAAIIGMGINVGSHPEITDKNSTPATSLTELLSDMNQRYQMLKQGAISNIVGEWSRHSLILGKRVTITDTQGSIHGLAESVDDEGCLILQVNNGSRKRIMSGDVSLQVE